MAYKSKTAMIYRSDGTLHGGPRNDYTTWGRGLNANAPGIAYGDRFIQIGSWRICDIDGNHASICTTSGKTAQIFRADGTLHGGPRNDYCCHGRGVNNNHANRPKIGDRYIQIGRWRFGDIDGWHSSASTNYHGYVRTAQIWRGDGTLHGGGYRSDWHCFAWGGMACGKALPTCRFPNKQITHGGWAPYGGWHSCSKTCGGGIKYRYRSCSNPTPVNGGQTCAGSNSQSTACNTHTCPFTCSQSNVRFGHNFLQIGDWRFGDVDGAHFSMAYKSKTAMIYRSDGTLHGGPRNDYTTWGRGLNANAPGIAYGDRFIQIGSWRICDIDGNHASICTTSGKTAQIFRADGTLHGGPRNDYCCHGRGVNNNHANRPKIGDRYIQIGRWRFGDIDGWHSSASTNYHGYVRTAQIWRGDGTLHGGGYRSDWHCFAWGGMACGRQSQQADAKVCANK